MAAGGYDGRRLPCPCSARQVRAARTRLRSALAVVGLTALAVLCVSGPVVQPQPATSGVSLAAGRGGGSGAERIALIAIAVLAVAAFGVLQLAARSRRHRWSAFPDWRTWPPGFDPWAGHDAPVAGQHEGSAYRPGYGFLPGAPPSRSSVVQEARHGTDGERWRSSTA
jgi:hypothetical protein